MPRISGEPLSATIGALCNTIGPAYWHGTPTANSATAMYCPTNLGEYGYLWPVSPTIGRKWLGISGRILATSQASGATLSIAPALVAMGGATPVRDTTRASTIAANVLGPYTIIFATPLVLGNSLIGVSFIASAAAAMDFDATMLLGS